jgi:hypothetical protein
MQVQYNVIFHHDDQHGGRYSRRFLEAYGQTLVGKEIVQNHYPHVNGPDRYPLYGENRVLAARYDPELHTLAGIVEVSEHTHERIRRGDFNGVSVESKGNEFNGLAFLTQYHEAADKGATILGLVDYKKYIHGPIVIETSPLTTPIRGSMERKREIVLESKSKEKWIRTSYCKSCGDFHKAKREWVPFEEVCC